MTELCVVMVVGVLLLSVKLTHQQNTHTSTACHRKPLHFLQSVLTAIQGTEFFRSAHWLVIEEWLIDVSLSNDPQVYMTARSVWSSPERWRGVYVSIEWSKASSQPKAQRLSVSETDSLDARMTHTHISSEIFSKRDERRSTGRRGKTDWMHYDAP